VVAIEMVLVAIEVVLVANEVVLVVLVAIEVVRVRLPTIVTSSGSRDQYLVIRSMQMMRVSVTTTHLYKYIHNAVN
jgi:hypothetical protein